MAKNDYIPIYLYTDQNLAESLKNILFLLYDQMFTFLDIFFSKYHCGFRKGYNP